MQRIEINFTEYLKFSLIDKQKFRSLDKQKSVGKSAKVKKVGFEENWTWKPLLSFYDKDAKNISFDVRMCSKFHAYDYGELLFKNKITLQIRASVHFEKLQVESQKLLRSFASLQYPQH